MSKPIVKAENKIDKLNNHLKKEFHSVPAIREVKPPAISQNEESNNFIAVYKDLNQPLKDLANVQRKHLFIAFFVFIILGLGIMIGQSATRSRGVATSPEITNLIPSGAQDLQQEHYHYDKSCYTGNNGEQVCMTRTSRK